MVRIAYAAQLPTPAEVIRAGGVSAPPAPRIQDKASLPASGATKAAIELVSTNPVPQVGSFEEAVALFEQNREILIYTQLRENVRLVRFEPGVIELRPAANMARDFLPRVGTLLTGWTGQPWKLVVSEEEGSPSLHEQENARKEKRIEDAAAHPLVSSVLSQFPGAKIVGVKPS